MNAIPLAGQLLGSAALLAGLFLLLALPWFLVALGGAFLVVATAAEYRAYGAAAPASSSSPVKLRRAA